LAPVSGSEQVLRTNISAEMIGSYGLKLLSAWPDPIYLKPGKYAFTLRSGSEHLKILIAETDQSGNYLDANATPVSITPPVRVKELLRWNSGEGWVLDPQKMLSFELLRMDFSQSSGVAAFT